MITARNIVVTASLAALLLASAGAIADETVPDRVKPSGSPNISDETMWQFGRRETLCIEWTDDCRGCRRTGSNEFTCSSVGISCQQKEIRCTSGKSKTPQ
jgi:hypothetical protein